MLGSKRTGEPELKCNRLAAITGTTLQLILALLAVTVTLDLRGKALRWSEQVYDWDRENALPPPARSDLSADERFFLKHISQTGDSALPAAEAMVQRFPDDPGIYAHYIRLFLAGFEPDEASEAQWQKALRIMERGKAIDPENAVYNYCKAYLLMAKSSKLKKEEGIAFKALDGWGKVSERKGDKIDVHDSGVFEEGVKEFLKGTEKPFCTGRVHCPVKRELELRRPMTTFPHYHWSISRSGGTLLTHLLRILHVVNSLPDYAVTLASEKRKQEAISIITALQRAAVQLGARADCSMAVIVAYGIMETAKGQAPGIYRMLGEKGLSEQAQKEYEKENAIFSSLCTAAVHGDSNYDPEYLGITESTRIPGAPGLMDPVGFLALRRAEHIGFQRVGVAGMSRQMLTLMVIFAALALFGLLRGRDVSLLTEPMPIDAGWMAWLVALGIALPLSVYAAYAYLSPWSPMKYGLPFCGHRLMLESNLVRLSVCAAVLVFGYHGMRKRCQDAGIEVPSRGLFNPLRSPVWLVAGGIVLAGFVVFYAKWQPHERSLLPSRDVLRMWRFGRNLSSSAYAVVYGYIVWQFWRLKRSLVGRSGFGWTLIRSYVPVLAFALIIAWLASHFALGLAERNEIRKLSKPGHRLFIDNIENSRLKDYRKHLAELSRR